MIEIAKAWGHRPTVLILDEPTSSLGPVEAAKVLDLARRHAAGGEWCCSSATVWTRCRTSPTGWSCCAAASWSPTSPPRRRPRSG
ncbi:hypothetical protein ACFQZC_27130 [Streptacidiphilus monticola]